MPTVYGLKNCDSCRKARKWLQRFDITHDFVDVRETLPAPQQLLEWKQAVGGWDALVNRASTTWRQLPPNRKAPGSDAEWKLLLREYPALIKRPLLVLDDGRVQQGFSDNGYKKLFGVDA
ncbi:Spx/MgsR family RNA polymerase-binding regulatory protein [Luteimonas sp. e5]